MKDKEKRKEEARTYCFLMDNKFEVHDDLGQFCVFGDESRFVYKAHMEKEEAEKFAAEMTKNKSEHNKFMEALY